MTDGYYISCDDHFGMNSKIKNIFLRLELLVLLVNYTSIKRISLEVQQVNDLALLLQLLGSLL